MSAPGLPRARCSSAPSTLRVSVEARRIAGLTNTLRQVGTATGVAVLGALYASRVTTATEHALAGLPAPSDAIHRLAAAVASGAGTRVAAEVPAAARAAVTQAAHAGTASGLNDVLLAAAAFAVLGAIAGFAYGPDPAKKPPPSPAPGELSAQSAPAQHHVQRQAGPEQRHHNPIGCDIHSADRIMPEWQHVVVGAEVRLAPEVAMTVAAVEPGRALVLRGGISMGHSPAPFDSTWAFVLREEPDGTTRLVSRERYEYLRWWAALVVEPTSLVSFVMSRKMLHGIAQRAQRPIARPAARAAAGPGRDAGGWPHTTGAESEVLPEPRTAQVSGAMS